jgi:hypothetical protein
MILRDVPRASIIPVSATGTGTMLRPSPKQQQQQIQPSGSERRQSEKCGAVLSPATVTTGIGISPAGDGETGGRFGGYGFCVLKKRRCTLSGVLDAGVAGDSRLNKL